MKWSTRLNSERSSLRVSAQVFAQFTTIEYSLLHFADFFLFLTYTLVSRCHPPLFASQPPPIRVELLWAMLWARGERCDAQSDRHWEKREVRLHDVIGLWSIWSSSNLIEWRRWQMLECLYPQSKSGCLPSGSSKWCKFKLKEENARNV